MMSSLAIPTEKTKVTAMLGDQVIIIYGAPKIGKSTFASQFPNALFVATEPGLSHLEVYQVPVTGWVQFKHLCGIVAKDPLHIETLVIDTIDILYLQCFDAVCKEAGVEHPSDESHGKVWSMVSSEFRRVLARLSLLRTKYGKKMGLVMVSHVRIVDEESRTGTKRSYAMNLSNSPRIIVTSMSDLYLFADVADDGSRVLRTKGTKGWAAGDRTGMLPETMPLSYDALSAAFSNVLTKKNGEKK